MAEQDAESKARGVCVRVRVDLCSECVEGGSFWAALVAQMVKHLPTMQETWVKSLHGEDRLENGLATHPRILSGESHGQRRLVGYIQSMESRRPLG